MLALKRYTLDFVAKHKITYGLSGAVLIDSIDINAMDINAININDTKIPTVLNTNELKAVILNVQQGKIKYLKFLEKIMLAGCCKYDVYITSGKVIYFGKDGREHVEYFPLVN